MSSLKCPLCQELLLQDKQEAYCKNNHHFDRSKVGYFNLHISNKNNQGDNKAMIQSRDRFLNLGYYQFLVERCLQLLEPYNVSSLIDVGCGQGYYTQAISEGLSIEKTLGIDLSKEAIIKASKKSKKIQYVIASIAKCPVVDNEYEVLLNGFAPKFIDECLRLVKPNGYLLFIDVGTTHLMEMKQVLYSEVHPNQLEPIEHEKLVKIEEKQVQSKATVIQDDLKDLLAMTPYQYKTKQGSIEKLLQLQKLDITFEFVLRLYQKKG